MTTIVSGKRRFTRLSPRLVRLEFSPNGVFEDRPSLAVCQPRQALPFDSVDEEGDRLSLVCEGLTITSTQKDMDFFPANLRIDFPHAGRTQTWRFGDRDFRNLGGSVRSLDYYGRDCLLEGVHPAGGTSPNDFLHFDSELFEAGQVYMQDGHFDWQLEMLREGLYGLLRHAPEKVYNRYVNMAGDLTRYQPGLLSRSGYFVLSDSTGMVLDADGFPCERATPGTRDLYFFAYGDDYRAAWQDFRRLCGPAPLPPRHLFGILFSRWPAFSAGEAIELTARFAHEQMPLAALLLDLEWHIPDFSHWDWNPQTYPDPEGFLAWAHSQDLLVGLNIHPQSMASSDSHFAPFVQAAGLEKRVQSIWENPLVAQTIKSGADRMVMLDLAERDQARALQNLCLHPLLKQGVDFWWVDGPAAQANGADGQLLTTRTFYEASETPGRRALAQARYGGLGSHRYGVFFTGDTYSQWEVLRSQCEFNIRAGQMGMAYISHDIGGFSHTEAPVIDPDLYVRWLQFGVFSPVLRFHSAPGAGSRQPWDYGSRNLEISRKWLQVRHSLLPYLYGAAHQVYDTGLPLVRGVYVDYPDQAACYRFDEFFLGELLLVAPVLGPANDRTVYLPPGGWRELESGRAAAGGREIHVYAGLEQVPVYVRAGSILLRQGQSVPPGQAFVSELLLDVYPGGEPAQASECVLYEDDGRTLAYQSGEYALTRFQLKEDAGGLTIRCQPGEAGPFGLERRVSVRAALPEAPAAVTWDGQDLPAEGWGYDSDTERLLVDLGTIPSGKTWELRIIRSEI